MPATMKPRERLLATLHHTEPDRVPTALWGSAYGITDGLYFKLVEYLNLGQPLPPFRRRLGHTVNHYDDRILEALEIDIRHVWCGFPDLGGPQKGGGADAWGVTYTQSGPYLTATSHPLASAMVEDLETYPWPRVDAYLRLDELKERARYLREHTAYAVVGRAPDSYGIFERCCTLRGTEQFLMDLVDNPSFAEALIAQVSQVLDTLFVRYLETAGPWLDVLELPGDDYAGEHPIISPRMFDRFFAPAWRRLISTIRSLAPHIKLLFHSDGNMAPFLGRLVDLGIDIFHSVEPLPGVDWASLKARYQGQLCFWGGIDIKQALQGPPEQVIEEVKNRIRLLSAGGGYVLAPSNHLQPDIPPQNVVILFKAAQDYGRYPLL